MKDENHVPQPSAGQPQGQRKICQDPSPTRRLRLRGTQVELCFPDDYPGAKLSSNLGARNEVPGIYHVLQTPAIIRKIVWAENNGYDAVVQSNTFDPGVEAARQTVRIPVIGVFRTALHVASVLSNSIAIIVPLEEHIAYAWQIVYSYGMQGFVKDIAAIGLYDETAEKRIDAIFARATEVMRATIKRAARGASFRSAARLFQPLFLHGPRTRSGRPSPEHESHRYSICRDVRPAGNDPKRFELSPRAASLRRFHGLRQMRENLIVRNRSQ